jgi:predicted RNase H-like HicB family nuclease
VDLSGGYTVSFPDFGWGVTQGDDLADAVKWAGRLLNDLIALLIMNSETLPEAKARGRRMRAVAFSPGAGQGGVLCGVPGTGQAVGGGG